MKTKAILENDFSTKDEKISPRKAKRAGSNMEKIFELV